MSDEASALSESESSSESSSSSVAAPAAAAAARQRRARAQTYSIKPLPAPMFGSGSALTATPVTAAAALRTRGATFTAQPASSKAACELCGAGESVCCKVSVRLKGAAATDDGGAGAAGKVSKRLCKRCALQQQEFAEVVKIVGDDEHRLAFLTAARKWSDLALKAQEQKNNK